MEDAELKGEKREGKGSNGRWLEALKKSTTRKAVNTELPKPRFFVG